MIDTLLDLDERERAQLYMLVNSEGFIVLDKIMKIEVEKFREKLVNLDGSDPNKITAAHSLAKSAAQFYVGLINRLNVENEVYLKTPRVTDTPVDVTEGVLDIGERPNEDVITRLSGGENVRTRQR